ncbi:MAG TPA: prolipoprotein diacylglyceryl transferase family protein [Patescibacteria group bacterium]|nr:prolipoprotein diacylglyceryl transferase family protein [Patescibacteria group bacterium]
MRRFPPALARANGRAGQEAAERIGRRLVARRTKPSAARNSRAKPTRPGSATTPTVEPRAGRGAPPPAAQPPAAPRSPSEKPEPQALVISHWFDSGDHGEPYTATVRLTGRRVGASGRLGPGDTFAKEETVEGVIPGSGPVALTSWVYGLKQGEWQVTAELEGRPDPAGGRPSDGRRRLTVPLPRAAWSWRRWAISDALAAPVPTRWAPLAPLASSPAVLPGAFTALAGIGIAVGIAAQAALMAHLDLSVGHALLVIAIATLAGLLGAKLWHMVLMARPWRQTISKGWSVDGFLVVAPVVAVGALLALDLPVGTYFDAGTPGIFFAVVIGRVGCFVTGCCAGRSTASRWGIWCSDRRVCARRIPTQLLESAIGLVLGIVSLLAVLNLTVGVDGAIFVIAFVAYGVARQGLLRLRAESRQFSWRRSRLATQDGSQASATRR